MGGSIEGGPADPGRCGAGSSSPAVAAAGAGLAGAVGGGQDRRAARRWWDAAAAAYQADHGGLSRPGPVRVVPGGAHRGGRPGCSARSPGGTSSRSGAGAAQCARWLAAPGARVVAVDISAAQLAQPAARPRGAPGPG